MGDADHSHARASSLATSDARPFPQHVLPRRTSGSPNSACSRRRPATASADLHDTRLRLARNAAHGRAQRGTRTAAWTPVGCPSFRRRRRRAPSRRRRCQRQPHPLPAVAWELQHWSLAVGSQHAACVWAAQQSVSGLRARMMAEAACGWTRCVSVMSMSVRPAAVSAAANSLVGERAGDAAGVGGHVGLGGGVHVGVGDDVGDGEAPAGLEDARGLAQDLCPCRRRG